MPSRTIPDLVAALREAADRLDTLTGDEELRFVQLDIQPGGPESVDALGTALLGKAGATDHLSSGNWHHAVDGTVRGLRVCVYCRVDDPTAADKDAEIERLRAELAALTATAASGAS